MKYYLITALAVLACVSAQEYSGDGGDNGDGGDLAGAIGLSCPSAGYMFPDTDNLCFVWLCERGGEAPIKRACPKGVRVPSWWEGGELNMCNIVNIEKHGGVPTCLRCAADDVPPADHCEDYENPCPEECECINQEYTHRCDCPFEAGVYPDAGTVEFPANHCEPNPCENGASCQNQWDGYFCFCPNGWTGHRCETSVCDWHPCLNGGTCVIDEVGYHCECTECFSGSCCNETIAGCTGLGQQCGPCEEEYDGKCVPVQSCGCQPNKCEAGTVCFDGENGPQCDECPDCWTGPTCKVKIDSCKCNSQCPENARCEDLIDVASHECICNDCYEGENCDVPIESCECNNPCDENEACNVVGGAVVCGCSDSCVTGPNCDERVNSCECSNPCVSGECQDTADGPVCNCDDCHEGEFCEVDIINCDCANPCDEGETCSEGANGLSCGCDDPCKTGPGCTDTINSCECANPCNPNQVCSLYEGELTCSCADACTTGENCETTIETCECNDPCQNDGTCVDGPNGQQCEGCANCFGGDYCEQPISNCDCHSPCTEGEVCNMVDDAPVCGCPDCYTGAQCDVPVDSCECNNQCINPDTCEDSDNGAICVCDCVGNEVCGSDNTCKCPICYYNKPGETGCESPVTHLCVCNNPCTEDQQVCVDGSEGQQPICKIGNPSSGNAFTVVFEENDTEKAIRQIPLELYLTPAVPNSGSRFVNIRSPGLKRDHHCYFNENVTIPENGVFRYEIERCMMHNKTGLDNVSIRLTELNNDTMLVYGINKDRWSADGFLATPDVQAGMEFQTLSYSPAHKATQFAIAALYDDTEIEIELSDVNDLPAPYNVAGAVYKLTMQAFETFQVQATCPLQRGNKKSSCTKDLSGTVIRANKNIHVFSGNIRAFVKAGEGLSRDHLVEELVPTDRWGTKFGLMTVPRRAVGDLLNIMALKGETTNVEMWIQNGGAPIKETFTLPMNGRLNTHREVPNNKRVILMSDKPISVAQLTKSLDTYLYSNETVHDPVSITVPPIDQFTNNFFISTPFFTGGETFALQPYNTTYALMVARAGQESDITLDGQTITDFVEPWAPMPSVSGIDDLVGAVIVIPHGTRLLRSESGNNFQVLIYGFDDRESYGFPAAMNFAKTS